jgi:hypothetical protein
MHTTFTLVFFNDEKSRADSQYVHSTHILFVAGIRMEHGALRSYRACRFFTRKALLHLSRRAVDYSTVRRYRQRYPMARDARHRTERSTESAACT